MKRWPSLVIYFLLILVLSVLIASLPSAFKSPLNSFLSLSALIGGVCMASEILGRIAQRADDRATASRQTQEVVMQAKPTARLDRNLTSERQVTTDDARKTIAEARRQAESALMAKSEFLATMSHEIRTPLNGIIPLVELVLSSKLDEEQREQLTTVYRSGRELLRIVDSVLDYSKIESGHIEFESANLNLRDLAESVAKLMSRAAQKKSLALTCHFDPKMRMIVRGDSLRLRQVLTNLVSNAIKFTSRGGVILGVTGESESATHRTIRFSVKDTGPGIDSVVAKKLFQPFTQADASTTREFGGTGLGLAICRRLVDAMGGKIGLLSEPGAGSEFWFSVPLLRGAGEAPAIKGVVGMKGLLLCRDGELSSQVELRFKQLQISLSRVETTMDALTCLRNDCESGSDWTTELVVVDANTYNRMLRSVVHGVLNDEKLGYVRILILGCIDQVPAEIQGNSRVCITTMDATEFQLRRDLDALFERSGESGETRQSNISVPSIEIKQGQLVPDDFSGRRVLLVDDLAINRHVSKRLLEKLGVTVELAENGRIALNMLDGTHYDAVLMDCQMPDIDGYTAARSQRQRERELDAGRVPIIALTANAMLGDREKCLGSGMDDYLSKPIDRTQLAMKLAHWFEVGSLDRRASECALGNAVAL